MTMASLLIYFQTNKNLFPNTIELQYSAPNLLTQSRRQKLYLKKPVLEHKV